MASKRKASKSKAKAAAKNAAPKKKSAASAASKKRPRREPAAENSPDSEAKAAKTPAKRAAKQPAKQNATKKRQRKKSAVVETTVAGSPETTPSETASAAEAEAGAPKKRAGRKKKPKDAAAPEKPEKPEKPDDAEDVSSDAGDDDGDDGKDASDNEDANPRLRSQPVEVQEIDVRIARARSSRIKPFEPRSFGPDPKKPPKPIEVRDQLNRYMGKALPIAAKNRPATVVELGIYAIFALGAKSSKAALEATRRCVTGFSDWNEFRISDAYEFVEFLEDLDIPDLYDRCERVLEFVRDVYQDMNEVTLEHLRDNSPEDRLELLSRYQSLGPALTHYLGLAIQDFDGVIFHYSWARVGQRVGVLGRSNSPKTLAANLKKSFKGEDLLSVQVNLIELGEETCTSQRPNCKSCCLVTMCVNRKL